MAFLCPWKLRTECPSGRWESKGLLRPNSAWAGHTHICVLSPIIWEISLHMDLHGSVIFAGHSWTGLQRHGKGAVPEAAAVHSEGAQTVDPQLAAWGSPNPQEPGAAGRRCSYTSSVRLASCPVLSRRQAFRCPRFSTWLPVLDFCPGNQKRHVRCFPGPSRI